MVGGGGGGNEIWHEDRCTGKVIANFLRILLKIISAEIIAFSIILTIFGQE